MPDLRVALLGLCLAAPAQAQTPERLTLDVLKSARSIAVLLYLVRRHGRRTAMRLARAATDARRAETNNEEDWLSGVVRSLRHVKREHDAAEVLRIASSPELAAG